MYFFPIRLGHHYSFVFNDFTKQGKVVSLFGKWIEIEIIPEVKVNDKVFHNFINLDQCLIVNSFEVKE